MLSFSKREGNRMSKKTMIGEVRKAMEVTLGDKVRTDRKIYNDWHGRKTLPNCRDFNAKYCVRKRLQQSDIDKLRRSLQQRMSHFGLKVTRINFVNPFGTRGYTAAGDIYITCVEING